MTKNASLPTLIGPKEFVSFPELAIDHVPAKVDTGADSSAIWATDAHPTSHGLEFMLFGTGSKHFTGKRVTSSEYRTTSVKNSFGVSETRYKVRLAVYVSGRRIRGWFTLSDRSKMLYPVLLGRRLLKNRFLVDVGKGEKGSTTARPRNVLILSKPIACLADFAAAVQANTNGISVQTLAYDDLLFRIETGNISVTLPDGTDIAENSFIFFKNHEEAFPFASAAARYAAFHHIPFVDQELARGISYDKLSEAMALATHGLAVAPLFCSGTDRLIAELNHIVNALGVPFICKEIRGSRGRNNFIFHSKDEALKVLSEASSGQYYMLQKYIMNKGYLRLLVLGSNVELAIQRTPTAHADPQKAHLNNPSGSQNASLVDPVRLPSEAYNLAVRSADIMHRQVAGVDVIQDEVDKTWYILEVNHAPQLVGGAFPEEKRRVVAKFIEKKLER